MIPEIDDIEWIRLAMAIDCEGSISIGKHNSMERTQYDLYVQVYNTNELLVDWIVETFGFGKHIGTRRRSEKHKQEYAAYISGLNAAKIIERIKPHLLLKYKQAKVALEFSHTISNHKIWKLPPEVTELRELLYLEMKSLNKKGN